MKKYLVTYTLEGQIEVMADSKSNASDIVKGLIADGEPISDKDLINGIEGYSDLLNKALQNGYTIDGDAIKVISIEEED